MGRMMHQYYCTRAEPEKNFIKPGFGFVARQEARLWTVVGAGVAITLFDRKLRIGGMAHYTRPFRQSGSVSNAFFAAPAIIWLLRQLMTYGSRKEHLEAQLFGGAVSSEVGGYVPQLHRQNVQVGMEILKREGLKLGLTEVGGERGRKVLFNSGTGESAVAWVNNIRAADWYPSIASEAR